MSVLSHVVPTLTPQRVCIGALAGLTVWQNCQKMDGSAFRWLKKKLGPMQVVYDPQMNTQKSMLESRRAGSDEVVMTRPRSQCQVGVMRDGDFVVIGCALRFESNMLVGPDHVLGGDSEEIKHVRGTQNCVSLRGKERIPLDTDLVAIRLTDQEFATIGVSVCKIGTVGDKGTLAQIVGSEGKGTVGVMASDPLLFGRVTYAGTTLGGYSGAAYTIGAAVVGIHQMGGKVNGGYSASYVWSLIRIALEQRFEASEDWLLGQFKAGKKIKWQRTGDPDVVQVYVDGYYSAVEPSSMAKAFGVEWQNNAVIEKTSKRMAYGDYESADFRLTAEKSGASNISAETDGVKKPTLQDITAAYKKLSTKQKNSFQKSLGLCKSQESVMAGQTSEQ
uniref:Uncharacterized protein n=1 Tax=Latepeofons virus TaxID=3072211 RepID=A0AA96NPD4_9VIRU|nr:MAG: hypothetical protein [Latepeofons virus]